MKVGEHIFIYKALRIIQLCASLWGVFFSLQLINIIISSFRNCGRIIPRAFGLTPFLIQLMDAHFIIHLDLNKRQDFPPFCSETTFGKLIFKMNNELISWPVNLLVARRPVNSQDYFRFGSMNQGLKQSYKAWSSKFKVSEFSNCPFVGSPQV